MFDVKSGNLTMDEELLLMFEMRFKGELKSAAE
jgi:hypothetical protein